MYHLDFESLGQPLCKAVRGWLNACQSRMAEIDWNIQPLSLQWMGTTLLFLHTKMHSTFEDPGVGSCGGYTFCDGCTWHTAYISAF